MRSQLKRTRRVWCGLLLLLPLLSLIAGPTPAAQGAADPAFDRVWGHCDQPVAAGMVARSWMWGPAPFFAAYEPYAEGPGGQHLVSYFDKSRMEINNPGGDRNSTWFVTNGLLVVDMIAGRIQTGNYSYVPVAPAQIPVAGDTATSLAAPTYAGLAGVASLAGDHRAADRQGQMIVESLNRAGAVGTFDAMTGYARYGNYQPVTGHNIADVFWRFMTQQGVVYHDGRYEHETLVDWLFAMGYPITEPYWIQIHVGTSDRWVLMQAFQRRILTYSPTNPAGWEVEMGNVGRAYFDWRYPATPPAPTPTFTPTPTPRPQAHITLDPDRGSLNTPIRITGQAFPAYAAITLDAVALDTGYVQPLATAGAGADGAFQMVLTLPAAVHTWGDLTIRSSANGGTVRATAIFHLTASPSLILAATEVPTRGKLTLRGIDFPAKTDVTLGVLFSGANPEWLTQTRTDGAGNFTTQLAIGSRAVGARFQVVALVGNQKMTSEPVRVIAAPGLAVVPASGPAGSKVMLYGHDWPAYRAIRVGLRPAGGTAETWLPASVSTTAGGDFATTVTIPSGYPRYAEVVLIAYDPVSQVRLEVGYTVTPPPPGPTATPTPRPGPVIEVIPPVLVVGQAATIHGHRWTAGGTVTLGLRATTGGPLVEALPNATADGAGNFSAGFVLSAHWQGAAQAVLVAQGPGGTQAQALITVLPSSGRITPQGRPLEVHTHNWASGPVTHVAAAEGWRPGQVVTLAVIAANGSIDVPVASAPVEADGSFAASFTLDPAWQGRADLGVRVRTGDGQQVSVAYLPWATADPAGAGTYAVRGANWPAGAVVQAIGHVPDSEGGGTHEEVLGQVTTDGNGNFTLTVALPVRSGTNKTDLELRVVNQPYGATFDL